MEKKRWGFKYYSGTVVILVFWVGFLDDEEIDKNILNKIEEKELIRKMKKEEDI